VNVRASVIRLALAALAWPACVKVNEFTYRDAAPAPTDDAGDGGGSGTGGGAIAYVDLPRTVAELPGVYKLEFSPFGFHYPDRLMVASRQLLGPTAVTCGNEEGVGIMYAPAGSITSVLTTGIDVTPSTTPLVTVDLAGPGVARVSLDWSATFTQCNGTPTGRTIYTFFPDGRIARGDITSLAQTVDSTDCFCASDSSWEHSTYTTFDSTHFTATTGTPNGVPVAVGDKVASEKIVCMAGVDHRVALGWRRSNINRVRRITTDSVSFLADMSQVTSGSFSGDALESTTMYVDTAPATNCTDLTARVQPFTEDLQLEITVNTTLTPIGLGLDGIYGGESAMTNKQGGYFPDGAPIVLKPFNGVSLPAFAIWLDLSATPTITSVTRSTPSQLTEWYTVQQIEPNEYVLWFPDGLSEDQTITIEAQ
jgi:hypothetical protein